MSRFRMNRALVVLLLLLPCPASAQTVHKCMASDGVPVYQDRPCGQGTHTTGMRWDAGADRTTPEQQRRNDERILRAEQALAGRHRDRDRYVPARASPRRRSSTSRASANTASTEPSRHARCQAAKAQVARWERQLGLTRGIDDLRRWGDYEREHCNGP